MSNLKAIPKTSFEKLQYNPIGLSRGQFIQDVFEEFHNIIPFHDPLNTIFKGSSELVTKGGYSVDPSKLSKKDCHLILSLAILITDKDSPLVKAYRKWEDRKSDAINRLGITNKDLAFMEYKHDGVILNRYIFEYFRIVNDTAYEAWFSARMAFHEMSGALRAGLLDSDVDEKQKILKTYFELQKELERLELELFPDKKVRKRINQSSIEDSIGGYAEKYALMPLHLKQHNE